MPRYNSIEQRLSVMGTRLIVLRQAIQRFYSFNPNPVIKEIIDKFVIDMIILLRKEKHEKTLRGITDEDIFRFLKGLDIPDRGL